ncbi:hypothetical protein Tco_0718323 [Tanacetum coccineum]
MDSTVRRVVPLLLVSLARAESELEASVDKLFNKGGSADQVDSAANGGQDAETKLVTGVKIIANENVTAERPKHQCKKRPAVSVAAVATLPLVTSSVSATPERESGAPTDSITGLNLRTISAFERFVISSDSFYHSSTHASGAEVDSIIRSIVLPPVMTEAVVTSHAASDPHILVPETGVNITSPVHALMFHDSDSTETMRADATGPSYSAKQDLSMGSQELNAETLHQIHEMDYHHLFTEFNVGTARQACLNAEVRMQTDYCLSERIRLESECKKQADLLKVIAAEATKKMRVDEIDALKQRNVALENEKDSLDVKVIENVHAPETTCSTLRDQVSGYNRLKEQIEEFQYAQMNIVNDKVAKLDADLLEMALHLEEKFYPHILTTISDRRWLLTRGVKLAVIKCLNSTEYLTALGSAISRAIEKGMQDGCRPTLTTERQVDFPLLAKLNSHKDASTADIMDLLRLGSPLADAPGISHLQPDVEQLTLPIHRPEDQVVLGETSLSFALSTSSTSGHVPAAVVTTTALSTTFASASSVPPLTTDDYEIVGTDGQEDAQGSVQGNAASFPIVEFEKEELDTTP